MQSQCGKEIELKPNIPVQAEEHHAQDTTRQNVKKQVTSSSKVQLSLDLSVPKDAYEWRQYVAKNEAIETKQLQEELSNLPETGIVVPLSTTTAGYVKRPLNAFMLYSMVNRSIIKKADTNSSHMNISITLGARWRELGRDEKKLFAIEARKRKIRHMLKYPNYKFHSRRVSRQKRRIEEDDGLIQSPHEAEQPENSSSTDSLKERSTTKEGGISRMISQRNSSIPNKTKEANHIVTVIINKRLNLTPDRAFDVHKESETATTLEVSSSVNDDDGDCVTEYFGKHFFDEHDTNMNEKRNGSDVDVVSNSPSFSSPPALMDGFKWNEWEKECRRLMNNPK